MPGRQQRGSAFFSARHLRPGAKTAHVASNQGAKMTEAENGFDLNGKEIAATVGIVMLTIVAAMMVPAIREKFAALLNKPTGA